MAGRCEGDVAWFNTEKRIVEFNIGCSAALQLKVFLYSSYLLLSAFVIQSPLVHKTWTQRTDYRRPTHTLHFQGLQDMTVSNQTYAAHTGLQGGLPHHTGSKLSEGFYAKT
jgi:hypothetical protein